jgi:Tol biopolymer transport system component
MNISAMKQLLPLFAVFLPLLEAAHAAPQVGSVPYRASATGAGNSHSPIFSADGRHIAFVSHANNLVTNDDLEPHLDLFVRDLVTSNTVLVSVSANGFGGANDNVALYTLSSNAQFVAFETAANNLASGDTNRFADIYVRDMVADSTRLVSVNTSGVGSGNGPSSNPLVSEDGSYVIFESLASNLVTNDFNGTNDIFIHDLTTGITELVSVNAEGTASPDGASHSPSISADGLTVAFVSHATNVVEGVTNSLGEIYARNLSARTTRWAAASHLPSTHQGFLSTGGYQASEPVLSSNGRFVAFKTLGQAVRFDLTRPTNTVFLAVTNSPLPNFQLDYFRFEDNPRLALSTGQTPLAFTRDGRFLAFNSASNLSPNPGIVVADFEMLTTNVFPTFPTGLFSYTTNVTTTLTVVLTNSGPSSTPTWSQMSWLSLNTDATRLSFLADATNLVAGVTNRASRLYSYDIASGLLTLVSTNRDGEAGPDLGDIQPTISPDGSLIAWDSPDDKIVADDSNRAWDVFVRNVDTGDTQVVSARHPARPPATALSLSGSPIITADGRHVVFVALDGDIVPLDQNGALDAFRRDIVAGRNQPIGAGESSLTNPPTRFTAAKGIGQVSSSVDGRFISFVRVSPNGFYTNAYRADVESGTVSLVNQQLTGSISYDVENAAISPDGQLVAFVTRQNAAALVDPILADPNGSPDIFVRDYRTGTPVTRLVSYSQSGTTTANGSSINPIFSPDGRWIVFQSAATDLVPGTFLAGQNQFYARDLANEETRLVSISSFDDPTNPAPLLATRGNPAFSLDGRFVAFEGTILAASDSVFLHDLHVGSGIAKTNLTVCVNCATPSLNADGRWIVYETRPAPGAIVNIVAKNLGTEQEELVSVNLTGGAGNASSTSPLISYDARHVVFASKASDLVANDTNRATDIFVRDRLAGVTHCVSQNWLGTGPGNRVSSNPVLAANGRTVAFQSFASDLIPGDYNDTRDVFVLTLGGPDTDGDGMDDDWEMAYFSTLSRDGSGDFDIDGASDLDEFRAGTIPANDASILRVLTLTTASNTGAPGQRTTVLLWSTAPGRTYQVQFKVDLDAAWIPLGDSVLASGTTASQLHTASGDSARAFYRVLLVQ